MGKTKLALAIASALSAKIALGEVVFDGTVGPAGNLNAVGGVYTIDQAAGRTVGTNLFHSFGSFNIATGQSAVFTGAASIDNVISRVTGIGSPTGLQPSVINGKVSSTIATANF